ncbi:MAG: hypothetical protein GY937_07035 [bacterium]|nr:hypothetical protein [bacterium]
MMLRDMLFVPGEGILDGAGPLAGIPSCPLEKGDTELRPGANHGDIFASRELARTPWNR